MSSIKFNYLTRKIEVEGTKAFIESNFNMIKNLLIESYGVKRKMLFREPKTKTTKRPISFVKKKESQTSAKMTKLSEVIVTLPATEPSIPKISHTLNASRPPLRKYIRREGRPGHERISVQVVEQKPNEISIASLKEKFGLSESKIEGVIRDAEKQGKVRKVMNGSYVWTQD